MIKPQYPLFYDYSKMLVMWLKKTLGIKAYGSDEIDVVYMTPARAFAKYIYKTVNGRPVRPLITLHLNTMEYSNENLGGFVPSISFDYNKGIHVRKYPLLIYRLSYGLTVYTKNSEDADNLLFQLLGNAPKNYKAVEIVNGHWAEFWCGDIRDETNLEPGDFQDKLIRYGLDMSILRAYIPRSKLSSFSAKPIKSINVETEHLINSGLLGDTTIIEVENPGPPKSFVIVSGDTNTESLLKWEYPEFDGRDDIIDYKIEYSKDNYIFETLEENITEKFYLHKNLTPGEKIYYRVFSRNREGFSDEYAERSKTP